jgi:hypothetical protein
MLTQLEIVSEVHALKTFPLIAYVLSKAIKKNLLQLHVFLTE